MNITRRKFVGLSGMAALSAAVLGPAGKVLGQAISGDEYFQIPVESANDPLNYLLKEHFDPFVGTTMIAGIEGERAINLRLIAVRDWSIPINVECGLQGVSYSLLFENVSRRPIAPGIYIFDHDVLGRFSLALLPVGQSGKNYEAVINRLGN